MTRYLLRRLAYALVLLLAVVTLNFLLIHISPGDPVETIAGSMGGISEELRAQLRTQYGLDKPFLVQLGMYLSQVLRGDLGYSYFFNVSVAQLIWERVPATLLLVVTSVLGAFLVGTLLGTLAARKPNGPLSQGITLLSVVGYSAPVFWTGIILILLFASVLPIFPVSDMRSAGGPEAGWAGVLDVLHHLVLPAFTLAFVYLAQYSRLARANGQDLRLSPTEFRVLQLLLLRKGALVTKSALMDALYNDPDEPEIKSIDVLMHRLRKRLAVGGAGALISTVWGAGYIVRDPATSVNIADTAIHLNGAALAVH